MNIRRNLRLIAAASIIVLAAVSTLAIPYLTYLMAPLRLIERHVDPNAEVSRLPLPSLMVLLVLNPFASMLRGNFSGVSEELRVLESAYIPSGLRFIIERFVRLMNDIASRLDRADKLMDEAEALIDAGRGSEAKPMLAEASREITLANATYKELRSASEELAKAFSLPRGDIYLRLNDLGRLIDEMYWRLLSLLDRIERQTLLIETFLSINVEPRTVWTGGVINVEGRLYALGDPLSGRSVVIFVGGSRMAEVSTARDGSFNAQVNLPYIYKPSVTVQARYTPLGVDARIYKPSTSDAVEVSLLYIEPKISLEPVRKVLPGKTFTVRGKVQSTSPLPYSSVKVSWIGGFADAGLLEDGRFEARLRTPGDVPDGKYTLKVNAPASGVFAPASVSLSILVERIPINVTIEAPVFALAGFGALVRGSFQSGDDRFNATVKVYFAGQEYSAVSSGNFSVWLSPPLTLLSGYQACRVRVTPSDPWYSEATCEESILVVNPITILAPIGVLIALAVKVFGRRGASAIASIKAVLEEKPEEAALQPHKGEVYFAAEELRWLMDIYWEAVGIASDMTGVVMEPYMTMREFLTVTAPHLGKSYWYLETLTLAAERALYSPSVPAWAISTARMAINSLKTEYAKIKSQS